MRYGTNLSVEFISSGRFFVYFLLFSSGFRSLAANCVRDDATTTTIDAWRSTWPRLSPFRLFIEEQFCVFLVD